MLAIEHPWVFWPLVAWLSFILVWAGAGAANIDRTPGVRLLTAVGMIGLILIALGAVALLVDLLRWSVTGDWP